MAAPLKPWERAGVNSRAFGGDLGNTLPPPIVRCVVNSIFISCTPTCQIMKSYTYEFTQHFLVEEGVVL